MSYGVRHSRPTTASIIQNVQLEVTGCHSAKPTCDQGRVAVLAEEVVDRALGHVNSLSRMKDQVACLSLEGYWTLFPFQPRWP